MMAFFVRLADDYGPAISCFQKSFFRNIIALAIASAVLLLPGGGRGRGVAATRGIVCLLVARSAFGTAGIFANFKAISDIPIAEAMTLLTVPLVLRTYQGAYSTQWNLLMAASCIALAPVILLYLVSQKFIISGIMLGGIKG